LQSGIQKIRAAYPGTIKDVRGKGFMQGIEFNLETGKSLPTFMEILSTYQASGYFLVSYFLHRHNLRLGATLNNSNTLRIEPSGCVDVDECINRILEGVEACAKLLYERRFVDLSAHMWRCSGDLRGSEVRCDIIDRGCEKDYPDLEVVSFLFNVRNFPSFRTAF
jgi:hypothetical protein